MERTLSKKILLCYYALTLVLCFADIIVYLSMKSIWFFINKTANGMFGLNLPWAWIFFILFCISFIYMLINLIAYSKRKRQYGFRPRFINIILPGISVLFFSTADAFIYSMLGSSKDIVVRNIILMIPYLLIVFAIIFLIIFYPGLSISKNMIFRVSTALIIAILVTFYALSFGNTRITSGPYIQCIDDSSIAVIWTTNKNSTGYVEYGTDKKNIKEIKPSVNGIYDSNTKLHKVIIPVGSDEDFIYRVVSTKINNYYQNNVEFGNTVKSDFKEYKNNKNKDSVTFCILNDVHENKDIYKKFLSGNDYDFAILNGDTVNSVDSDDVIINEVLKPVSLYTNGTKPIYIARGNHETRGAWQGDFINYMTLPNNSYYYSFSFGPVYAVVLDSGEDKLDSNEEYSGLADFKDYLEKETKWLSELSKTVDYKNYTYRIAFVHIPLNSYINDNNASYLKDYEEEWTKILNSMKINAVFSGHTHVPQIINADNTRFNFPIFIAGGEYGNENNYAAVKVNASSSSMKVQYLTYDGRITYECNIKPDSVQP